MIRQDILRFFLFFLHFYCPRNREGHTRGFVVKVLKVEKATPEEVEEMEAPELLEVADLVKEASETKH